VGTIINYSTYRSGVRPAAGRKPVDPIVAEIMAALDECGGSAHREIIANAIASRRAGRTVVASRDLQDEVYGGFERYVDQSSGRRQAARLCKPFGPDSYRWALTSKAEPSQTCRKPEKLFQIP